MVEASDGTHTSVGPHRGIRLKQRGNDTNLNSDGEYAYTTLMCNLYKSGFRNHRPQWVALFNVTSK